MSDEHPNLSALAGTIADGAAVDWPQAEASLPDVDLELIEGLRLLERIADVHASVGHASVGAQGSRTAGGTPRRASTSAPEQWGPMLVRDFIGHGTFGDVYRAWDPRLDRQVALKLLAPRDTAQPSATSSAETAMVHEGRFLAKVRHVGVVTVHGADVFDGRIGIWMELIEGRTLEQEIQVRGALPVAEVARIGADISAALAAVHRAGLIHRDVKAQNVMREPGGRTVLMDFGTGRDRDIAAGRELAGTPLYLAPEVIEGGAATTRSDVYSLGVLLFYLATAEFPVAGQTLREVRRAQVRGERREIERVRPGLPREFTRIIDRALAECPEQRFEDADEMARALATVAGSPGRRRQRTMFAAVAAAMLAAGAGVTWLLLPASPGAQLGFQPNDALLIARFENHTSEPVFDGAIEYALERELLQSRIVGLVSEERVQDGLQTMKLSSETVITRAIAREIAMRDGQITAILIGDVRQIDGAFVLTSQLVAPAGGAIVATFSEQAVKRDMVPAALTRHARRIREALGEHLAVLPARNEATQAGTTRSLRAFQLYNQAYKLGRAGQWPASVLLARAAIAEDPEFASGWIWLAWGLSRDPAAAEEMHAAAERAVALSAAAPEWERLWITGSAHFLRQDYEASLKPFRALLQLRPDHHYGASNLSNVLAILGKRAEAAEVFAQIADLRPLDAIAHAWAAAFVLGPRRDGSAARPYVERARRAIATTGATPESDPAALWIALFDAYVDWRERDVHSAQARLDAISNQLSSASMPVKDQLARTVGNFYVSLGQLRRAESVFMAMTTDLQRQRNLLTVDLARTNPGALAARIRKLERDSEGFRGSEGRNRPTWYLQAGLNSDARRIVEEWKPRPSGLAFESHFVAAGRGDLALLDGRLDEAREILQRAVSELHREFPHLSDYQRACQSLGLTLTRLGRRRDAIRELESCAAEEPYLGPPGAAVLGSTPWMDTRMQLADLYRADGRVADARRVESDLWLLLAVADADHAVIRRLKDRE
jgi:serine/threonine-protein kinase